MTTRGRPVRLLLVGLGNRGRMWAEVVRRHSAAVISGGVDIDPARLDAFRAEFGDVPTYTEVGAALGTGRHDAVLLATFPAGRLRDVALIASAGLPLLAEKPLTLDLNEAASIVALMAARDLPLMIGLNFRYLPVSRKIRDLVADQTFGAPGFGLFAYLRNRDGRQPRLNKYPLTMQHPMMLEQSIHHLDLIRYCYGREVEAVACRTWNPSWSMYAHDANVSCLLTLQGGMEVAYTGTWAGGWNELQFQWRTDCSDGVIVQRQLFGDLAVAHMGDPALTPIELPAAVPFYDDSAALLSSFVAHLHGGAPLECSGADHLRTLALCFAAIESSALGRTVRLDEYCARHGVHFP